MKKNKLDSYLGFARRAGKLSAGSGTCQVLAKKGKLKLLIITEDMASGSAEKLERIATSGNIPYRIYGSSDRIGGVTGYGGRTAFAITDKEFASLIMQAIDREIQEQEEVLS